jgi:hypothetical protein
VKHDSRRYHQGKDPVSFKGTLLHFLGEVEAIFGIWLVPLILYITFSCDWHTATQYIDTRNYTEPLFVVVIMAIAASRPVVAFAETALSSVASIGKKTPAAWWLSILVIAPLLGFLYHRTGCDDDCGALVRAPILPLQSAAEVQICNIGSVVC